MYMISIIVPVYNVEKYLPKCIDSILAQTYKNFELILVDDGSPDNSGVICDVYSKLDSRIKVIHQVNRGVSAARNAGLKIANGKYIGFVDPDDWIDPYMYEDMRNVFENDQVDLVICGYDYYDENGNVDKKRKYRIRENEYITQKEIMYRFSDIPPSIRHGVVNKLLKKKLLQNQIFKEGLHSSEDVFFLNEYVLKIKNAVIVHKPYYKNLVRQGSATHGGLNIDSLADSFIAHDKMYRDITNIYPDLKDYSQAFLLDVCTLKYNEAKKKIKLVSIDDKNRLNLRLIEMKKYIKKEAVRALFNKEIYWKTRIYYMFLK